MDGVCWQPKPGLGFLPDCYLGDVCTREREPGRGLPGSLASRDISHDIALVKGDIRITALDAWNASPL